MQNGSRHVGLFVSHLKSARIDRHFARLRRESEAFVDWHLLEAGKASGTVTGLIPVAADRCMPVRFAEMEQNGGVLGGFLDVLVVPFVLAAEREFAWIVEYDVDFSGHWGRFFEQFEHQDADVLTTTLYSKFEAPDWCHWQRASAPAHIRSGHYHRAFSPIMRLSRRFGLDYIRTINVPGWRGHYEFTLPTAALAAGRTVEDLGGLGRFCPANRLARNYTNTPANPLLIPGTFVWRPSLSHYFHERPNIFGASNMLHHPIKPDMESLAKPQPTVDDVSST